MGGGRWSSDDWTGYKNTRSYSTKTTADIYNTRLDKDLDPKGVKVRESRDSKDNPNSNAIIFALDVTGSMSPVLDVVARSGLNTLVTEIYDRKPVTDPHVMVMGIGDAEAGDRAPLQVTQFEADIRIQKWLEKIYLEKGGGGNSYESYALAPYFASTRTAIDCFEKRGKKGYLFTIGDEEPTPHLRAEDIERVLGDKLQGNLTMADVLTTASRQWEIFHLIVEEGDHARAHPKRVVDRWTDLLGQRALRLSDVSKLAEVIVSAIQINEGVDAAKVVDSWDGSTAIAVRRATSALSKGAAGTGGIVTL